MTRRTLRPVLYLLLLIACFAFAVAPGWSQKPPPGSQAPTLNAFLPVGLQRGQTVELNLAGANLAGPTGLSLGTPGRDHHPYPRQERAGQRQAQGADQGPSDTPLGLYPLRLATARGLSNVRLVAIDELPQVVENDKNNSRESAQPIPVPSAVSGRADAEKADYYKITVSAGQRLSFDVLGRRLGSPIDPQLTIYHDKMHRALAFDNDSPGCQGDPRLSYTFKEAGDYLIEIKDVLNRGGPDYVYRLRVGDFPLATTPVPMAARRAARRKCSSPGRWSKASRRWRSRCRATRRSALSGSLPRALPVCTAGRLRWRSAITMKSWRQSRTTTRPRPTA